MKFAPLLEQEASYSGFTHRLDFSYQDIPAGIANNTAKVWSTGYLPIMAAGMIIVKTEYHLTTPFAVSPNDAAFTTSTVSFGDASTATRYINASESNINGTEIIDVNPGANQNVIYTAANQLQLTLNSMAAKTVSSLNVGKGYILLSILNAADPAAMAAPPFGDGNT